MLDVALNGSDGPVSLKEVSVRQNISLKYMEQIGALLVRAGFLKSVRGAQGGYNLVGAPADYTVGMILRITESQLDPAPCVADKGASCPNSADCLTAPLWERLNEAISGVIDTTTLQDLIDGGRGRGIIEIGDGPAQ